MTARDELLERLLTAVRVSTGDADLRVQLGRALDEFEIDIRAEPETFEVVSRGWSDYANAPRFDVISVKTGGVVYEADDQTRAEAMCDRYNREGRP